MRFWMAAASTAASMRPCISRTLLIRVFTASGSDTSTAGLALTSATITFAPAASQARAVAAPMPEPPPVTRTTEPAKSYSTRTVSRLRLDRRGGKVPGAQDVVDGQLAALDLDVVVHEVDG